MNFPPGNLSHFHSDVLQQTQLGQLCGQGQLFRDRYQVLRMIGRGGFGVTFLAKDIWLPSEPLCVIKQLCPKVSDPPALESARRRFEREAKILSKLGSHSQIPMLLDYFTAEGEFYLVQEYIKGATLARLIRRSGPLSEGAVKYFLREMLPLLQYVHKHQVIHRDIKPQNIIRCQDDGRLVLIDFGAVKEQIALGDTSVKLPTTHFIGTMGFAPPEQFTLRPVYGSDIYALGVTCLYLLTGRGPLDFDSDRYTGEILWHNSVHLSTPFMHILDKMLRVSLKERYQSVTAILHTLDRLSPHDNLGRCLAIQNPLNAGNKQNNSKNYRSPTQKTAIAIRDWKARFRGKPLPERSQTTESVSLSSSSSN
ncbi:MAG: serine/threonine protein kinase [Kastovskya adunca ATA6-11-RM4]|jgi:serine/threonine protein kinase|nr:serine/threonine protein kinase [Kastovskya adunca ATA6-11-RM4]